MAAVAALLLTTGVAAHAEPLKIATVKSTAMGAFYIAMDKGYFAAAGIEPQIIAFDSPGLVPPAVVSGSADIGSTGVSAQLYALASQGAVRIFAGQAREHHGFQVNAFILSNAAAAGGLTSLDKLAGHSVAISLIGSPVHYAAAQVALKHGVALDQLRFLALQANGNILSAVTGGSADTGVIPGTIMTSALARDHRRDAHPQRARRSDKAVHHRAAPRPARLPRRLHRARRHAPRRADRAPYTRHPG
jgi:NitT/TauT family transport system substrate-binding protein